MITNNYPSYALIKKYYDKNVYTKAVIKEFTDGGAITKEEYKKITGDTYPKDAQD